MGPCLGLSSTPTLFPGPIADDLPLCFWQIWPWCHFSSSWHSGSVLAARDGSQPLILELMTQSPGSVVESFMCIRSEGLAIAGGCNIRQCLGVLPGPKPNPTGCQVMLCSARSPQFAPPPETTRPFFFLFLFSVETFLAISVLWS